MRKAIVILFLFLLVSFVFSQEMCYIDEVGNSNCDTNGSTININTKEGIPLYFFYSDTCPHCHKIAAYLNELEEKYDLNVIAINVRASKENMQLFKDILYSLGSYAAGVPVVVIDNVVLQGETQIRENLEPTIKKCETKTCRLPKPIHAVGLNFFAVTMLAFADSINPCALAVLLILLSMVMLRFNKKAVLRYGFAFILTIFISYFLMGVLVVLGFKALQKVTAIGTPYFMLFFGVVAVMLGILNLKDALAYGFGGFVMEVPFSWRPKLKALIRSVESVKSAIIIAFLVSFFLLPCTAGPYFVMGGLMHNVAWFSVFGWLLYYNLIFVLPMVFITLAVFFGFSEVSELEEKRQKAIRFIHFIASLVLIGVGIYLIICALPLFGW